MLVTFFFFFNDPATTEIYTLSLHDALPICIQLTRGGLSRGDVLRRLDHRHRALDDLCGPYLHSRVAGGSDGLDRQSVDRKSTRLNSSHANISYAVFCLKKKIYNYIFNMTHI